MASQTDFASLDQLRLLDHGDAVERFYWPKVLNDMPDYEVFWRKFIVLLTNRVNPFVDEDWIMLREGLDEQYESLLMANYTTFYHCVVAQEQIEIGRKAKADRGFNHPELFFFSAKACLDNLNALQAQAGGLLRRAGMTPRFPTSPDKIIHAITSYRDVFTHRSHLGRGSQHGRDLIPALQHLPRSKKEPALLWSYTMALGKGDMTDALDYQSGLWDELAKYLQGTWKELANAFERFRVDATFIKEGGLSTYLPIHPRIATDVIPSLANPLGASGMMMYEDKKGP